MDDHVIGALHESGVDRQERTYAFGREASGEEGGVFFGDADIEVAIWKGLFEDIEFGATRHGCRDGDDFRIIDCEIGDGFSENFRAGGSGDGIGGAVFDLVCAETVEFSGVVDGGLVAAAFFRDDVEYGRFVEGFEVFEGFDQ